MSEWTEGVAFDGAAILRDGVEVPVEDAVATLNRYEDALREIQQWRDAYPRDIFLPPTHKHRSTAPGAQRLRAAPTRCARSAVP